MRNQKARIAGFLDKKDAARIAGFLDKRMPFALRAF